MMEEVCSSEISSKRRRLYGASTHTSGISNENAMPDFVSPYFTDM
jgi:hypothetical protein